MILTRNPELSIEMGNKGRKIVFEKYSWMNIIKRTIRLYHEVIEK